MKCSECKYGEHIKQIDTWFCNANKEKPKRIDRTEVNLDVPCKHIVTNKSKSEKIPIMLYPQVDGITPTVVAVKGNFRDTWDETKAK